MRFFRSFLPNLTISLNLVLMIVIYLDMRNPMMGFLIGTPFVVLVASCCICSIATAVVLYAAYWKAKRKFLDKLQEKE